MVVILIFGTFVSVLNQTVMSPALPTIMADTGIDAATAQWLTTGFTLVNAIMIPVTAFLTDRFSLKWLFIASMAIFGAGSAVAGFGPNFPVLLAGRLVQAAGAGILGPLVMVALLRTFPIEHRGRAMGIFGIVIAFAPALGPTIAGIIIDVANWHVLLYAIAVLSANVVIVAIFTLEREDAINPDVSLDVLSVVLSSIGFGALLYGLSEVGSAGVSVPSVAAMAIGAVALVFFFRRQIRLDEPMLNVRVLANRKFLISTIVVMLVQASLMAGSILLPIFIQDDLGFSATVSGIIMLPAAVIMGIMSPVSGTLFDKYGPRMLSIIGLVLVTIGTFTFSVLTSDTTIMFLIVLYAVRMFGLSLVNMPVNTWGMNALDMKLINHGTSVSNTFRQVAGSIGTAVLVSVSTAVTNAQAAGGADPVQASIRGINFAFGIAGAICVVGLVLVVLFVRDRKGDEAKSDPTGERRTAMESVMKRDVYAVPADATVLDAMRLFVDKRISAAPLVDAEGRAAGFVSDGDIMRFLAHRDEVVTDPITMITQIVGDRNRGKTLDERLLSLVNAKVAGIASHAVVSVNVHASFDDVCQMLGSHHLKKVSVIDDEGRLVGVVNRSDIIKHSMSRCVRAADEMALDGAGERPRP